MARPLSDYTLEDLRKSMEENQRWADKTQVPARRLGYLAAAEDCEREIERRDRRRLSF